MPDLLSDDVCARRGKTACLGDQRLGSSLKRFHLVLDVDRLSGIIDGILRIETNRRSPIRSRKSHVVRRSPTLATRILAQRVCSEIADPGLLR